MSAKNGDKFEQQDVRGWGMPLWVALPRHQTLVYIICAFVHTTRKDVRSIYHIYVAYIRTCIYVFFVHLFFNSDLHRSISFDLVTVGRISLLSFHGGISFSIVPQQEDNRKDERKERRYSRTAGSAGVEYAAMGCSTKAPDIGLYNMCMCTYYT